MTNNEYAIGVDIGGTKIASVLINRKGTVYSSDYRMTEVEMGKAETINRILTSICNVMPKGQEIKGIGIDIPGSVDPELGIVENAVNLGWDRVELRKELQQSLGTKLPIYLQRDTYAQTLSEFFYGSAKNQKDYVFISIGSGLGAGAMVNGRLLQGSDRAALEIGHKTLPGLQTLCGCGKIGCVETILSGPGMIRTFKNLDWNSQIASDLALKDDLTVQDILNGYSAGDKRARLLLSEVSRYLGEIISSMITILNPALVIIGGGTGLAIYDYVISEVRVNVEQTTWKENYRNLTIEKSCLDSSALGAASLVWYGLNE